MNSFKDFFENIKLNPSPIKNNPFKLIIKLKQHTPMIHFQADQEGATLRGSEFKPKLDKFLEGKINNGNYKIKIVYDALYNNTYEIKKEKGKGYPLYFGNIAKNDQENIQFVYSDKPINVEFFSKDKNLLKIIGDNICEFLSQTNFGTRQSKGFGSFYLDENDKLYKEPEYDFRFKIKIDNIKKGDFENLFENIELFYKTLRSGINKCKFDQNAKTSTTLFYFKSFLFLYAKSKQIQWDKKTIKEYFFKYKLDNQIKEHEKADILEYSSNYKYLMRDLLGLSTSQNWKTYNATIEKNDANEGKDKIERFASPILFKPIFKNKDNGSYEVTVYIVLKKINQDMLDRKFIIKNTINTINNKSFSLSTPHAFDLKDYLKFCMNEGKNLSACVDIRFQKSREFKILNEIYSSLEEKNNA